MIRRIACVAVVAALLSAPIPAHAQSSPPAPDLVWPTGGATIDAGSGQMFTVRLHDTVPGQSYATISTSGPCGVRTFNAYPTGSGDYASGTPVPPLVRGTPCYWTATATNVLGGTGPAPQQESFGVGPAGNVGTGTVIGGVAFTTPLPKVTDPCGPEDFTLTGPSALGGRTVALGAAVNLADALYLGPIVLTGTGHSPCNTTLGGSGILALEAHGDTDGNTIDCPALSGVFVRVATVVRVSVSGACSINADATGPVDFVADVQFVPDERPSDPGGAVWSASFAGTFTITPE